MGILAPSKTVTIFGKEFSEREWRVAIKSNKGIFRRIGRSPENVVGPTLKEDLSLGGYGASMEITANVRHCNPKQQEAYYQLAEQDIDKATEYAFIVTNVDLVWKQKIAFLRLLLSHIQLEEKAILNEEALLEKVSGIKNLVIDPELERYFSSDFNELRSDIAALEGFKPDKFKADLDKARKHLEDVEEKIKKHLALLEKHYPYLF